MDGVNRTSLPARIAEVCAAATDLPSLASAVCSTIRQQIPFAFACLATTDPLSGLITWTYKTDDVQVSDEEFAAAEFGRPDINQFAEISRRREPVGVLSIDTGGRPDTCHRFREFLRPRFGFGDELRVAFRSQGMTWAVLALYRRVDDAAFDAAEAKAIGAAHETVADAIRRVLFAAGGTAAATATEPAVVIIDANGRVVDSTRTARLRIAELGGAPDGPLPTNVLTVAARARTSPELARANARTRERRAASGSPCVPQHWERPPRTPTWSSRSTRHRARS